MEKEKRKTRMVYYFIIVKKLKSFLLIKECILRKFEHGFRNEIPDEILFEEW